jgi:hypothetical protein
MASIEVRSLGERFVDTPTTVVELRLRAGNVSRETGR